MDAVTPRTRGRAPPRPACPWPPCRGADPARLPRPGLVAAGRRSRSRCSRLPAGAGRPGAAACWAWSSAWPSSCRCCSWSGVYVGVVPWFALAVLQSLYLALLVPRRAVALRRSARGAGRMSAAGLVAALWVGQEALRDRTPYGGFPWARLAFSQADSPLGHLAAVGGAPLVTFAVALVGRAARGRRAVAARLGRSAAGRGRPGRRRRRRGRPRRPAVPAAASAGRRCGWPGSRATSPRPGWTSTPSGAPCSTTTSRHHRAGRRGSRPARAAARTW